MFRNWAEHSGVPCRYQIAQCRAPDPSTSQDVGQMKEHRHQQTKEITLFCLYN
ncbi:hypothetical protein DGo_CA0575 [Deinococcus gobiensis I-0]|uniref:Uncharacterized protein n=1 Tax=Deinococcus gobiensis (strain DSM 21396 / JCM 16679 / CGMCC 1.7299 / I-0) TaxID=745776 RepID=H8GWN2_DEIGI|nr:hypothetical protein DGo_CA0575 [Deinococcus gobiensis I-0]